MATKEDKNLKKFVEFLKSPQKSINAERSELLYSVSKEIFHDPEEYHWPIKRCYKFIQQHKIEPQKFIYSLELLFVIYFKNQPPRNSKGPFALIEKLKKSKKLNSSKGSSGNKINLLEEVDIADFLQEMEHVRNSYLETDIVTMVDLIYKNFDTGYTYKTLLRKYYMEISSK